MTLIFQFSDHTNRPATLQMKFFATVSFAALVAAVQAQVTINTPANLVECQPTLLTWTGGQAPYFLVRENTETRDLWGASTSFSSHGENPSGPAIEQFPEQIGTSLTWVVDFPAGTSVGLLLRDSKGATSQSAAVTIQPGSSTDCLRAYK
uniref:Secreted protein n=1 Tax=Moniliophthora roreri TaxID=221103 RepID=A0A0W0FXC5_MONRR